MTALPKTALYQSGTPQAQQGIPASLLFNLLQGTVDSGIILGTRQLNDSSVLWPLDGQELEIEHGLLLRASIVYRQAPGKNEIQPFLTQHAEDGKHLVLVKTGLRTNSFHGNRTPFFHGVLPLTDGAHEVATWCSEDCYPKSDVPVQRMSLFQLSRGSKLLVGDIFHGPHQEVCLAIENGVVQVQEVPEQARGLMANHGRALYAHAADQRAQAREKQKAA